MYFDIIAFIACVGLIGSGLTIALFDTTEEGKPSDH